MTDTTIKPVAVFQNTYHPRAELEVSESEHGTMLIIRTDSEVEVRVTLNREQATLLGYAVIGERLPPVTPQQTPMTTYDNKVANDPRHDR